MNNIKNMVKEFFNSFLTGIKEGLRDYFFPIIWIKNKIRKVFNYGKSS